MSRERMSDRIVADYLRVIGSGELGEGASLPAEFALCARYGVSRSVVREAIRTLAAKGFIVASQGSTTVVAPRTGWSVLDPDFLAVNSGEEFFEQLQEARELLEPSMIALAVQRITDDQVAELERLHTELTVHPIPEQHARLDIAFHAAIAAATGNPILAALHSLISGLGVRTRARSAEIPGGVDRAAHRHAEIIAALRDRDAAAAEAAMQNHLRQVREELETLGYRQ